MSQKNSDLNQLFAQAEVQLHQKNYRAAHALCIKIIKHDVNYADAYYLLGILTADHKNFAKAIDIFNQAIQIDNKQSRYFAQLAKCQIAIFRTNEAAESIAIAIQLKPKSALSFDTIGVVLSRLSQHEKAVYYFNKAIEKKSKIADYRYNLAASLQFLGQFKQAQKAYEQTLQLNPNDYRAWSALSQLWKKGTSAQNIVILKGLYEKFKQDADACLHIGHALARHYEQNGDYRTSLDWLKQAKKLKKAQVHYNSASDNMIAKTAKQQWLESNDSDTSGFSANKKVPTPLFVVGMPRTGTTLADRILSSHPDVVSAGELGDLSLIIKRMTETDSQFVMDAETIEKAANLDSEVLRGNYFTAVEKRIGYTKYFVDKMPFNFFYAGLIQRHFPNARIICLRRNAMDVCLSNYRQLFSTRTGYYQYSYDLQHTAEFYTIFDQLADFWAKHLSPDRYTELHYEQLVEQQETETRRLLDFCGLDWNDACLNFQNNTAPVSTASSVQVRQPLYSSSVGRWKRYGNAVQPIAQYLKESGIQIDDDTE